MHFSLVYNIVHPLHIAALLTQILVDSLCSVQGLLWGIFSSPILREIVFSTIHKKNGWHQIGFEHCSIVIWKMLKLFTHLNSSRKATQR